MGDISSRIVPRRTEAPGTTSPGSQHDCQVKECLSKQHPRILFESRCVLQHSYTCCHTQCLPGSREHKGESYEGRTVWSNWKLRPTYLEGTHHSGASGYGSRPRYLE